MDGNTEEVKERLWPKFFRLLLLLLCILSVGIFARFLEIYTLSLPGNNRSIFSTKGLVGSSKQGCMKQRHYGEAIRTIPRRHVKNGWIYRTHNLVDNPSISRLKSGQFVAAWQESSYYFGEESQRIMFTVSQDFAGQLWETPVPLFEKEKENNTDTSQALWNPVLHYSARTSKLYLFYTKSELCKAKNSLMIRQFGSQNDDSPSNVHNMVWSRGGTIFMAEFDPKSTKWKDPVPILEQASDGLPFLTGNNILETPEGTWMIPFWKEPIHGHNTCLKGLNPKERASSGVLFSSNYGKTWQTSPMIGEKDKILNLVEPSIVYLENQKKVAIFAGSEEGHIQFSLAPDNLSYWEPLLALDLMDPGIPATKANVITLRDGLLAIVYNDMNWHLRRLPEYHQAAANLIVSLSSTKGKTWQRLVHLDDEIQRGLQARNPFMIQAGCFLCVAYIKGFSEEYLQSNDASRQTGVRISFINLHSV